LRCGARAARGYHEAGSFFHETRSLNRSAPQCESPRLFRATVVNPLGPEDCRVHVDGGVRVRAGRIEAVGPIERVAQGLEAETLDGVIVPGFFDVHIHWVQHQVRGAFHADLLTWLTQHIWPAEMAYADPTRARSDAQTFFADLLRAGTVGGMAYSSVHPEALGAAFACARGRWRIGNAVMTEGAPAALIGAKPMALSVIADLAARYGAERFVVTPRFALNCSPDVLAGLGALARAGGYWIQTHLAESPAELAAVARRFPEALDYTDVYDRAGLLGPRTVLGHCIHLGAREWDCLAARGCGIAHCPSSNEALGSGRMDLAAVRARGIRYALASDVGAGPSVSLLHVMQCFLVQHRAAGERVSAIEALYRATLAGAELLGWSAESGNLAPGKRADFVLLPKLGGAFDAEGWLEHVMAGTPAELERRPLATWLGGSATG